MKKRNMYFKIGLVILMVGLLVTVSACSKKKSRLDPMEQTSSSQTEAGADADQEAAEARAIAEEELKAQRLQEQKAMEEAAREKTQAREQFVNKDIYFNFDDASLSSDARDVLKDKVEWLRENPGVSVLIEGHCDERGTAEYNIALGQRRAQSVKTFMVNAGVSPSRLSTISYGEERPVAMGSNESAWAKNRRAHFRIQN